MKKILLALIALISTVAASAQTMEAFFDQTKLYTLKTARGYLPDNENTSTIYGVQYIVSASSEENAGLFRITGNEGTYHLYNVSLQKYLSANGTPQTPYADTPDGTFTIQPATEVDAENATDGTWIIKSNVTGKWLMFGGGKQFLNNDGWQTVDDGDQWTIDEVKTTSINYTSTDGNIVTPHTPEALGGRMLSNTYENGQGTIIVTGTMTQIGSNAFRSCHTLSTIEIPNTVETIDHYAFHLSGLTEVDIPSSVTSIRSYAFYGTSLTSVFIPESVSDVRETVFGACRNLESLSGKFTTDDNRCLIVNNKLIAFAPAGLTSYAIPKSVETIGWFAFNDCINLTQVDIPESVTVIGRSAFHGCSALTSVEIPNSVTTIETNAFRECSSLTSVEIPYSVTQIGGSAFYKCTSLTSVDIPESVTSIDEWTFGRCTSLESICIPESVTSIGDYALYGCTSLTSIRLLNETPPTAQSNTFGEFNKDNCVLYVPQGATADYQAASYWSEFNHISAIVPTAIGNAGNAHTTGYAYDLAGRKAAVKGLLIRNGRKQLVR